MATGVSFNRILDIHPEAVNPTSSLFRMSGLVLTQNALMGTAVQSFSSKEAVGKFFGTGSLEYNFAAVYFNGYRGKNKTISNITFANYQPQGAPGLLRSGVFSGNDYSAIKAVSGDLTLTINGKDETVHMDFSAANSMSDIASDIQTAFPDVSCSFNALIGILVLQTKATGADQSIDYAAAGDVANALKLSQSYGAIPSNGSIAKAVTDRMLEVVNTFIGFASFTHIFPLSNDEMLSLGKFAAQYGTGMSVAYIAPDSDKSALVSNNAASFGQLAVQSGFGCIHPVWVGGDYTIAALDMSYAPGLDFDKANGAVPFAGISSDSVTANVIDNDSYDALKSNNYNRYASFATASNNASLFYDGFITGDFDNIDNLYEIIYMQDACQVAVMEFIRNHKQGIPVNGRGTAIIRSLLTPVLQAMVNYGAILTGITPDETELAVITPQMGDTDISEALEANGYYVYVSPLTAADRLARKANIVIAYMRANKIQTFSLTILATA